MTTKGRDIKHALLHIEMHHKTYNRDVSRYNAPQKIPLVHKSEKMLVMLSYVHVVNCHLTCSAAQEIDSSLKQRFSDQRIAIMFILRRTGSARDISRGYVASEHHFSASERVGVSTYSHTCTTVLARLVNISICNMQQKPEPGHQTISPVSSTRRTGPNHQARQSPPRPPVSPITPVLGPTRPSQGVGDANHAQQSGFILTHSQPKQRVIPQPPPVAIDLESNPDVLAVKSAIALLQFQAKSARQDMQTVQQIKRRAMQDPEAFLDAASAGLISPSDIPPLMRCVDDDEDAHDSMGDQHLPGNGVRESSQSTWPQIPVPQEIVRCPPINWHRYAVEGDELERIHTLERQRPSQGNPQILQPDGELRDGAPGERRDDVGIASPYRPGKDDSVK